MQSFFPQEGSWLQGWEATGRQSWARVGEEVALYHKFGEVQKLVPQSIA